MPRVRDELAELVAIKSVADARQFPPEECARAAQWVVDAFREEGFTDIGLHETADGSKAVVGSRPGPGPDAPTVLLYAHYDVQPPLDDDAWRTPPFELTEVDGRWFGRGAADCKGNIVMHLTALRALGDDVPVNLKLVVEGSEEQGTGGLEDFVPKHADLLRADAILVCDTGNAAVGAPGGDGQPARHGQRRRARRGPARRAALRHVRRPGTGRAGRPGVDPGAACATSTARPRSAGLEHDQTWTGAPYDTEQFRNDAGTGRRRSPCWAPARSRTCSGRVRP